MKLNKFFALMLVVTMFTACSDDDKWNSNDVTVNMLQDEFSVKENKGVVTVPIAVEGELNAAMSVTVEVAEVGVNPAMEDVHYYVTSKQIIISEENPKGAVELALVDDGDINEARTFTVTIVDVKGGNVGANATTTVVIKDNDSAFYEKLQGNNWTLTTALGDQWPVSIIGYDEGEDGYDKTLYITGMMGYNWTTLELSYHFDVETKTGYLEIPYGTLFAKGVNFSGLGVMDVYTFGANIVNGQIVDYLDEGSTLGEWNDEFNEITFDNDYIFACVVDPATSTIYGYWNYFVGIKLTR